MTELVADLRGTASKSEPAFTPSATPDIPSIAVLPFTDMSPEKDQDYFCDGLAEELIDALAKLDGLQVVGRTSSFQYRDKGHDLRAIGEELKAKTVLEGSVRKAGNRLRINAQLINTEDGYHLWSERYDRTLDDVFDVQDDIARSVVESLKVELLGTPESRPVRRQPNLDAYQLYLRGNHAARTFTREGFADALTFYGRALAEQPDYPEALSGTSYVYTWQSLIGWADPAEIMPEAKRLALEAMAIDDTVSEAHLSLAQVLHYHDREFAGAEREYRRAIDLNPGSAEPPLQLAHFLTMMGRHDEARAHATLAIQLDPLDLLANWMLAHVNVNSRRFDAALDQLHKVRELGPTFWFAFYDLAVVHGLLGEYDKALSACTEGLTHSKADPFLRSYHGWICGMMGRREEAERIATELEQRRSDGYGSAVQIAWCYVGLRDTDRALEWLTTAVDDRDGLCAFFAHWPVLDPLRSDPRFQALLGKMNFPALPPTAVVKDESAVVLLSESTVDADAPTTVVTTPLEPDIPSIAVLPFLNMSADPEQEYFCDGLSEELIDALARLEGLRVVARTSAFQFRGKGHDLREVGQKLSVRTVLEGSVRKAGNRLRVNAQLINAEDGYHLWSERYDRDLDDVFEVQDDIARSVVEKLRIRLLGERDGPIIERPTDNLVS